MRKKKKLKTVSNRYNSIYLKNNSGKTPKIIKGINMDTKIKTKRISGKKIKCKIRNGNRKEIQFK